MGIIISSSKISWAVLLSTCTQNFMKLLQSHENMNWMSVTYVILNKIQDGFNYLFFQSGKKAMTKLWFQSKCCYSWKLWWPLVLIFQLPGSVLGYDNEDCQDHQSLLLKHQDIMQTTKYSRKIKQIY